MNWGYWGSVGVVADESYNEIMRLMGIGSIEPQEGMTVLQSLVASELHQVALIKTLNREALAALNLQENVTYYPRTSVTVLPELHEAIAGKIAARPIASLEAEMPTPELNELVTEIVASSLMSVGLFSKGARSIADLSLAKQPAQYYERWLSCSIRY